MRTTLKRGVGRSIAANGNGNGHAILPPAPLSAMVRYEQPPRQRRGFLRWVGRFFFSIVALLVMVTTAALAGTWFYGEDTVSQLAPRTKEVKEARTVLNIAAAPSKPATALVIGYDRRVSTESAATPSRSDTIMLVRMDPERKAMTLLSFPRDLDVPIICKGVTHSNDRINSAYSMGGPKCTIETVKALTGLQINYLVTVNFVGFTQVVDKLGGIWMDVDRRYYHENTGGYDQYASINLQPGYQKLFGQSALQFVRYRHTDNDLIRNARQQLFVRAVKDKITHNFHADTLPKVVGALRKNIEVAVGGGKELDLKTVINYALAAYELPSGNVIRVKLDDVSGAGVPGNPLIAPQSSIDDAVDQFLNPDVDAPVKAAAAALGQKVRTKAGPVPADVSVVVLNGNGVEGAATNGSDQLASRNYHTMLPPNGLEANAPTQDYFRTTIYYRTSIKGAKKAANQVANLFAPADVKEMPLDEEPASKQIRHLSNGAMLVVIVGTTFKGNLAPAPRDRTPQKQAPNVVTNPDLALSALRQARKVPFPLMVPTVVDRSTTLDYSGEPVRVYNISGDHKAVRITFRTGGLGYWGVEQTDWTDAPIFSGSNETRKMKGRAYQLYFSGSHLHMVVLRKGDRSYWVVNTLNDDLSNETMLAIARGLKPLRSIHR
jgi:LCP family protein required for cell wall assembly